jgi:hypothetical protein
MLRVEKLMKHRMEICLFLCIVLGIGVMGYSGYERIQYLDQRNLPAADDAVAEAAKGSLCMAERMKNDRTNRGQPVTNADLEYFRRDCDDLAAARQEQAKRAEAARRQAKVLQ